MPWERGCSLESGWEYLPKVRLLSGHPFSKQPLHYTLSLLMVAGLQLQPPPRYIIVNKMAHIWYSPYICLTWLLGDEWANYMCASKQMNILKQARFCYASLLLRQTVEGNRSCTATVIIELSSWGTKQNKTLLQVTK